VDSTLVEPQNRKGAGLTPEQEIQLQHLDVEIQIADKQLRLIQVKKQIAETELDIFGLQQALQQHLGEGAPLPTF
jgi:tRNA/tmRNA/rRNA uracil-C5-methylase (TrmA/RlmC/RlmD family)